ncbi:AMP-binding protein [Paenibacillus larvae]|nr:AMP-binding protein [Paenibacillus larvae]MDT2276524.1 AMP-binding protein [Paenibacillus larvae]
MSGLLDAEASIDHIQQDGVTILEVVPSYLSVLLEHLEPEQTGLEKLELLVVTGEALKPNLVGRWFGKYPGIRMTNAYGPTEASDDITHYRWSRIREESCCQKPGTEHDDLHCR